MGKTYIPLDDAKKIIVTALGQFDPTLGTHAAEILYSDEQANIAEVPERRTGMMMCRPRGLTLKDVRAMDMFIPGFAKKFGPRFKRQDNPADHAIVDFEYDGSHGSVVWLAHEVGHALADRAQADNGHGFKNFSTDAMEGQAYFVQHIVAQYMKDTLGRIPELEDARLGQGVLTMSWDRANQFTAAGDDVARAAREPPARRAMAIRHALDQTMPGPPVVSGFS